jgi:hypothetical protein
VPPLTPVVTAGNDRDARGHFVSGNKAACGNPISRRMSHFRHVGLEAVTDDDIRQLFRRGLDMALAGDGAAGALLAKYCLGKPRELDPDDVDNHEWAIVARFPSRAEFELVAIDAVLPAQAARLVHGLREVEPNVVDRNGRADGKDLLREREARRKQRRR